MRRSKQEIYEMVFINAKEVLLSIDSGYDYELSKCLTLKSLLRIVLRHENIYECMMNALYNVKSFKEMEKIISVMNVLFDSDEYEDLKKDLYYQLIKHMSIDRYMVLRHLVYISEAELIHILYKDSCADALQCAKYALIENDYENAIWYLKKLDRCNDDHVLDLIAEHSFIDYLSLEYYYSKKAKECVVAFG